MTNPYDLLGVSPDADDVVIEAAYRALAKKHHPDSGGDAEKFKTIKDAYEKLTSGDSTTEDPQDDPFGFSDIFSIFDQPVDTHTVKGSLSSELIVEGEYLTMALVGLNEIDVSEMIYDYQVEEVSDTTRTVAIFHGRNECDQVLSWYVPPVTSFIGDDGYTYDYCSKLNIPPVNNNLPSRLKSFDVDLEPNTQANYICIVEKLPEDVSIERIVYTQSVHAPGSTSGVVRDKERFEFRIEDPLQEELRMLPLGKG